MKFVLVFGLAFCCSVLGANVLNVNKSKRWVRNNEPYKVDPGLEVGDELEAMFIGNPHYYISFTDGAQGPTLLELRIGQASTSIQHTSGCEGYGPSFKIFRDTVTTNEFQRITITLRRDGLVFNLDDRNDQVLKLKGCSFPWQNVKFIEFGGDCKKTYGNWRNFLIDRD